MKKGTVKVTKKDNKKMKYFGKYRYSLDFSTERDDYMCETKLCSGELSPGEFDL